jgi:hypothetical protein
MANAPDAIAQAQPMKTLMMIKPTSCVPTGLPHHLPYVDYEASIALEIRVETVNLKISGV